MKLSVYVFNSVSKADIFCMAIKPKSKGKGKGAGSKGLTAAEQKMLKELQAKQTAINAAEAQRQLDEGLFSLFFPTH
jgi:hypothetical protein